MPTPTPRLARRGMTFLELVFATALVAVVGVALFSCFSFVLAVQQRERERMACMEVANRLVIAYLDDKNRMPDPNRLLEYGPPEAVMKFRWRAQELPARVAESKPASGRSQSRGGVDLNRFLQFTVQVWLSEESGGARTPDDPTIPQATLTRLVDPLAAAQRNPDAIQRLMSDPEAMRNLLSAMTSAVQGTGGGVAVRQRPTRAGGVRTPGSFGQRTSGGLRDRAQPGSGAGGGAGGRGGTGGARP